MISKQMGEKLNEQLNKEYTSHYIYLQMSAWCSAQSLTGAAAWFRKQADEEREHAMKFFDYIEAQQFPVSLKAIGEPTGGFDSLLGVFEKALAHEQFITKSIRDLYSAATEERDYATQTFLHWFLSEQVEEEGQAQLIIDRLRMAEGSKGAILYIDKELGKR